MDKELGILTFFELRVWRYFAILLWTAVLPSLLFATSPSESEDWESIYAVRSDSFNELDFYFLNGEDGERREPQKQNQIQRIATKRDYDEIRKYLVALHGDNLKAARRRSSAEFRQWLNTAAEPIIYITSAGRPAIFHEGNVNIWKGASVTRAVQTNRPGGSLHYDPKKPETGNQSKTLHHEEKFYMFFSETPPPRLARLFEEAGVKKEYLTFIYMIPHDLDHAIGEKIPLLTIPLPTALAEEKGIRAADLKDAEIEFIRLNQSQFNGSKKNPGLYIRVPHKGEIYISPIDLKKSFDAAESMWLFNLLLSNQAHDDKLRSLFNSLEEDVIEYIRICIEYAQQVSPWAASLYLDLLSNPTFVPFEGVATNTRIRANGLTSKAVREVMRAPRQMKELHQSLHAKLKTALQMVKNTDTEEPSKPVQENKKKKRRNFIYRFLSTTAGVAHLDTVKDGWEQFTEFVASRRPRARHLEKMKGMNSSERRQFLESKVKKRRGMRRFLSAAVVLAFAAPTALFIPAAMDLYADNGTNINRLMLSVTGVWGTGLLGLYARNAYVNNRIVKLRELEIRRAETKEDLQPLLEKDIQTLNELEESQIQRLSSQFGKEQKKIDRLKQKVTTWSEKGRSGQLTYLQYLATVVSPKYWKLTGANWIRRGIKFLLPRYIPTRMAGGKATFADGGLVPRGLDALHKMMLFLSPFTNYEHTWALKMARRQALMEQNKIVETGAGNAILRLQIEKALELGMSVTDVVKVLNVHRRMTVQMNLSEFSIAEEDQKKLKRFVGEIISIARSKEFQEDMKGFQLAMREDESLSIEERVIQAQKFAQRKIEEYHSDPVRRESRTLLAEKVNILMWDLHHSFYRIGDGVDNSFHPGNRTSTVKKFNMHAKDNVLTRIVLAQSALQMGLGQWTRPQIPFGEFMEKGLPVALDLTANTASNQAQGVTINGNLLDRLYEPTSTKEEYWKAFYKSLRRIHYKKIILQSASWIDLRFWSTLFNAGLMGGGLSVINSIASIQQITDPTLSSFLMVMANEVYNVASPTAALATTSLVLPYFWVPSWRFFMAMRLSARGGYDTTVYRADGSVNKRATRRREITDQLTYLYFIFGANYLIANYYGATLGPVTDFFRDGLHLTEETIQQMMNPDLHADLPFSDPQAFEAALQVNPAEAVQSLMDSTQNTTINLTYPTENITAPGACAAEISELGSP